MTYLYIALLLAIWGTFLTKYQIFTSLKSLRVQNLKGSGNDLLIFISGGRTGAAPSYKFFTSIVDNMLLMRKQYGIKIERICLELKKAVVKDLKQEKQLNDLMYGLLFQYVFCCLFSWFYLFYLYQTLEKPFYLSEHSFILCVHVFGLAFSYIINRLIYLYIFKAYHHYFQVCYSLRSFLSATMPISEAIKLSNFKTLKETKELKFIYERLVNLIKVLKERGSYQVSDFDLLIEELWDSYELSMQKYNRLLTGLKFLTLMLFIIPIFLYSTFNLLGTILL